MCPFCKNVNFKGNIHPNRLYIRADDKRYLCYNCGTKGNIVSLLAKYESLTEKSIVDKYIIGDYVELLPDELNNLLIEAENEEREEKTLEEIDLPDSFTSLLPMRDHLKDAYEYLNFRGLLNKEIIDKFDIRFCKSDALPWGDKTIYITNRVIFPIYFDDECYGWQARDITGKQEPKYLISKGLQKQLLIYNYDNIKNKEYISIFEGPVDAIKAHKINGTCLFGKHLSPVQENYLLECPNLKQIYLCLDNYDPEAVEAQVEIASRLSSFYEVFFIQLPYGKDGGDMTCDQMVEYKESAVKYNPNALTTTLI